MGYYGLLLIRVLDGLLELLELLGLLIVVHTVGNGHE